MPVDQSARQRSYANLLGFKAEFGGAPAKPANTVLPAITGTPTVGQTLTSTTGTWTGKPTPVYARQWRRDGVAVSGATAATYLLAVADVDAVITVTVTANSVAGSKAATSAATSAVAAS